MIGRTNFQCRCGPLGTFREQMLQGVAKALHEFDEGWPQFEGDLLDEVAPVGF